MGSGTSSPLVDSNLPFFELASLEGQWVIVRTTLPLWLKGDRMHPTLNYTVLGPTKLGDCVRYRSQSSSSLSEIVGVNTQQGQAGSARMEWRGCGALCWVTSDWAVVHMTTTAALLVGSSPSTASTTVTDVGAPQQHLDVGVIYFSKTMFTPEGVDIIVRHEAPVAGASSKRALTARELVALLPAGALERVSQSVVAAHPTLSNLMASLQPLPDS